jgi:hypothetical protein
MDLRVLTMRRHHANMDGCIFDAYQPTGIFHKIRRTKFRCTPKVRRMVSSREMMLAAVPQNQIKTEIDNARSATRQH